MGITISPWMMAFLMLMTGFAGFVDSAAGYGRLVDLPAYLFAGHHPCHQQVQRRHHPRQRSWCHERVMFLRPSYLSEQYWARLCCFSATRCCAPYIHHPPGGGGHHHSATCRMRTDDGTLEEKSYWRIFRFGHRPVRWRTDCTGNFAGIAFTTLMGFDLRTANGNARCSI